MARHACLVRGFWSSFAAVVLLGAPVLSGAAFAQSADGGFTAPGVIEPEGGVLSIGTAATGVVLHIAAAGDTVRRGQELARIDCAPLEASVRSLAGQADAARAAADRVRHGPRPAEIAVGEANVGVARARAEEAADALQRAQRLQVGISVTQATMQQVQRDARITLAQLEDARAKLDLLRTGSREEDITEADARRDAAKAAFEEARARLAQCSVLSPIDGVVAASFVSQGQFVSAAVPTVLVEVEDDESLIVKAAVEAIHFGGLCPSQHASIAMSGETPGLPAVVERIAPRIRAEPGEAPRQGVAAPGFASVTLRLEKQKAGLVPGEPVSVHFVPCHS